ncbi:MAG: ABC transporter substrate-binding protein [Ruminococcaceae bacterium]|nr:ABC transporter substrate-binding protein [Oscillospiraceae bacterium]
MKKLIALCLALTLLCGCNVDKMEPTAATEPTETTQAETQAPVAVKEHDEFGLSYLPEYGLNPLTCTATINRALFSLLYESLFVVSNQFRAEPVLCQSFKVSDDGMTYRFTLVSGVTFTDGSPLTAEDVRDSINAAMNSSMYHARLENINYVRSEDDGTLTIGLNQPYENFCLMLDIPILKATTLEDPYPVGTGPYVRRGSELQKNSRWWNGENTVLDEDRVPLSSAQTTNDLRDDFEFGSTDLIYCDPNSPAAVGYRCDYEVWEAPTTIMHYIGFNLGSGYFAVDEIRSALTYAIDRDEIRNVVYGGFAQASVLPCSPLSDLYDRQTAEDYDYAPAMFRAAVNNSGIMAIEEYANHVGYFLVCAEDPKRVDAANFIAEALNEAGLKIVVNSLPRDEYETALSEGEYDLYYGEVRLTANFDLYEFFSEYGDLSYGHIDNSGLTTLCNEALANSGSYVELCAQIMDSGMLCPVVFKSYAVYVTRGMISTLTPAVDYLFHNAATARTLADADKTYDTE